MVTKKVGIIGYPLDHSLSPIFQQAAFDDLNIELSYEAWPLQLEEIPNFMQNLRVKPILGLNVTIPYKEIVIKYLDDIHVDALSIGAVNTIVNSAGTLVGYNTDIIGFSRSLDDFIDIDTIGKTALILGAGGVARAALKTLILKGFGEIVIANRTEERAKKMAIEFSQNNVKINTIDIKDHDLASISKKSSLIVNCTSVGMRGSDQSFAYLEYSDIPKDSFVYDMIYNPSYTPLMQLADLAGAKFSNGLSMLINQGVESFKLWTGQEPDFDIMFESAQNQMIKNQNQ
ncbi:MAG: shikimate dehydrogenase [Chloroflexi bacterium]|nr:shikimate dehydrogenase [Chloroflexota bacterium]